jgi:RNA polymerase sigma-70 factor (ECF subfamily)
MTVNAPDELCVRLATDLDGTFAELLTVHQDLVYGVALRVVGDDASAQDVFQDAFIRAYRALRRYPAERVRQLRPRAWLARIALNTARNHVRSRRPTVDVDALGERVAESSAEPARVAERRDEQSRWARLLAGLPDRYRLAVGLRHVDGLSYAELAEALDRPIGSVKSDVHRGTQLLRAAYDAEQRALAREEAI